MKSSIENYCKALLSPEIVPALCLSFSVSHRLHILDPERNEGGGAKDSKNGSEEETKFKETIWRHGFMSQSQARVISQASP